MEKKDNMTPIIRHLQDCYSSERIKSKKDFMRPMFIRYAGAVKAQLPDAIQDARVKAELSRIREAFNG